MVTKLLLYFSNFYDPEEADHYEQTVCDGTSKAAEFLMKYALGHLELGHELYNGDYYGAATGFDEEDEVLAREAYLKGVQVLHLLAATDAASSTGSLDGGCDVSSSYSNLESLVGKGPVEFVHKVSCSASFADQGYGCSGHCDLSRLLDGKPEAFLKQFIADAIAAGASSATTSAANPFGAATANNSQTSSANPFGTATASSASTSVPNPFATAGADS